MDPVEIALLAGAGANAAEIWYTAKKCRTEVLLLQTPEEAEMLKIISGNVIDCVIRTTPALYNF